MLSYTVDANQPKMSGTASDAIVMLFVNNLQNAVLITHMCIVQVIMQ